MTVSAQKKKSTQAPDMASYTFVKFSTTLGLTFTEDTTLNLFLLMDVYYDSMQHLLLCYNL